MSLAFLGEDISGQAIDKIFAEVILEKSQIIPQEFKEVLLDIELIKIDKNWYISKVPDDLLDVLVSGFITTSNNLDNDFNFE